MHREGRLRVRPGVNNNVGGMQMEIKATRRYLDAACAYARDEKAGRRNRYHPVDTGTHAMLIIYRNDSAAKGRTSDSRSTYPSSFFPVTRPRRE